MPRTVHRRSSSLRADAKIKASIKELDLMDVPVSRSIPSTSSSRCGPRRRRRHQRSDSKVLPVKTSSRSAKPKIRVSPHEVSNFHHPYGDVHSSMLALDMFSDDISEDEVLPEPDLVPNVSFGSKSQYETFLDSSGNVVPFVDPEELERIERIERQRRREARQVHSTGPMLLSMVLYQRMKFGNRVVSRLPSNRNDQAPPSPQFSPLRATSLSFTPEANEGYERQRRRELREVHSEGPMNLSDATSHRMKSGPQDFSPLKAWKINFDAEVGDDE